MQPGDVFVWNTDQARGHNERRKFHIYIGPGGWRSGDRYGFLFISSLNYGSEDYPLPCGPHPFLQYDSFVSLTEMIWYEAEELRFAAIVKSGRVCDACLRELFHAAAGSETLPIWQIKIICEALKDFA